VQIGQTLQITLYLFAFDFIWHSNIGRN